MEKSLRMTDDVRRALFRLAWQGDRKRRDALTVALAVAGGAGDRTQLDVFQTQGDWSVLGLSGVYLVVEDRWIRGVATTAEAAIDDAERRAHAADQVPRDIARHDAEVLVPDVVMGRLRDLGRDHDDPVANRVRRSLTQVALSHKEQLFDARFHIVHDEGHGGLPKALRRREPLRSGAYWRVIADRDTEEGWEVLLVDWPTRSDRVVLAVRPASGPLAPEELQAALEVVDWLVALEGMTRQRGRRRLRRTDSPSTGR